MHHLKAVKYHNLCLQAQSSKYPQSAVDEPGGAFQFGTLIQDHVTIIWLSQIDSAISTAAAQARLMDFTIMVWASPG